MCSNDIVCISIAVKCSTGTYLSNNACELCSLGTYQMSQDQTSCLSCPVGRTTLSTGAQTVSFESLSIIINFVCSNDIVCISIAVKCSSGTYVSNGLCELCSPGTYQMLQDQTSCLSCPVGRTTLSTGTQTDWQCIGEFLCTV